MLIVNVKLSIYLNLATPLYCCCSVSCNVKWDYPIWSCSHILKLFFLILFCLLLCTDRFHCTLLFQCIPTSDGLLHKCLSKRTVVFCISKFWLIVISMFVWADWCVLCLHVLYWLLCLHLTQVWMMSHLSLFLICEFGHLFCITFMMNTHSFHSSPSFQFGVLITFVFKSVSAKLNTAQFVIQQSWFCLWLCLCVSVSLVDCCVQ
jgi:hypothetical protein